MKSIISFSCICVMGKSSGARPHAAHRATVKALRAKLGTISVDRWQYAQAVFDEMCALCEVKGPSGSMMTPRACSVCHYYGHTRQYCPVKKARDAARDESELERAMQYDKARGYVEPTCVEECPGGAEQWEWICHLNEIEKDQETKTALGMGCIVDRGPVTCASDIVLPSECGCEGCVAWMRWKRPSISS